MYRRYSVTKGLSSHDMSLRLRYWLAEADKAQTPSESNGRSSVAALGDPVSRRVFLASTMAALRYSVSFGTNGTPILTVVS
jgi:hypothetical protein